MISQAPLTLMDEVAVLCGALGVVVVLKAQRATIRGLHKQLLGGANAPSTSLAFPCSLAG